ncbi:T9SS type A sorting domain-containing protein [bacterium AH-315-M05]|nr:T9SS type A sorting domain-containing protein [bacterium AH-315-M05]
MRTNLPTKSSTQVNWYKAIVILLFAVSNSILFTSKTYASHSMGVDLTYECLGGNVYVFTLSFYRDCSGINAPTTATINASSATCGQNLSLTLTQPNPPVEVSALCPSALSTCQGGTEPGVEQYIYTDTITLPQNCSDWVFNWTHCCRNPLISNLISPSSQSMYIEATLNNTGGLCNSSPFFTTLPVPYICAGQPYSYNYGAVDIDGDSIVYSLVNSLTTGGVAIGYQPGYSSTYPIFTSSGVVVFNPQTGQMNLNNPVLTVYIAPDSMQVAVVTVLIEEYRDGVLIGSIMRDIQMIVLSCPGNTQPYISGGGIINLSGGNLLDTNTVEVCTGASLTFEIVATDADTGDTITMTSNIAAAIPGASFTATGNNPVTGNLSWIPGIADLGFNSFTITIQDDACLVPGSQTYLFEINVIAGTYAGPDKYLCLGDTVQLSVGGGTSFTWTPSTGLSNDTISDPIAFPDTTTTYIVTSDLTGSCSNVDTITVFVVPDYTLSTGPDQTICNGGSAQLIASASPPDAYIYKWTPSTGLNSDTISNPIASPSSTTTYEVTITSSGGCVKTALVTVTVNPVPLYADPVADNVMICAGDSTTLHANVSTGNCNDYVVDVIPFAPVAGSGTTVSLGDDASSPALNIGFNFRFFCNVYSQFFISSNGYLTFGSGSSTIVAQTLPDPTAPNNLIAFAWTDLDPGPTPAPGGGTIEYFTTGAAPNRILVMNFIGVPHYPGPSPNFDITTQVLLYETSNWIEIHTTDIPSNGALTTQGIENITGSIGFPVPSRNNTTWSASNDAVRFTPTLSPFTITWFDADSNIVGTDTVISVNPDSTTTYTVIVTNGVCIDTKSITVDVTYVEVGPDTTFCLGDSVQLNAAYIGPTGSMAPALCGLTAGCLGTGGTVDYVVGTGFSTNSSTVYPAPYGNWYRNAKHQILYTAADLSAAGVVPGMIEAIGFNVAVVNGTSTYFSYSIKIGTTPLNNLTNWQSGLQTVFTPKTVNVTTGWNVHTLDFPYDWDGSCNLIIELCYDNLATPNTLNSSTYYTTTGYTSVLYYRSDATPACPYTGAPSTSSNRPNTLFTICTDSIIPTYSWTPTTGLSNDTISNPIANVTTTTTYTVTVDIGICSTTDEITIFASTFMTLSTTSTDATCGNADGDASVIASGGAAPYTYLWDDSLAQTTDTATGLAAGAYTVLVTDVNGCIATGTMVVNNVGAPLISGITITVFECYGDSSTAIVSVSGGTPPYTYLWDDPLVQTDSIATGLLAGTYTVTVTGNNGCIATGIVTIGQPPIIAVSVSGNNVSCNGICDGDATASVIGNTPPYTYLWDDPLNQTTATADSLCAGIYTVSVTDANGCITTSVVTITEPAVLVSFISDSTNANCNGICDGGATVTVLGGTGAFSYSWNTTPPQSTPTATGMCAGTYSATVTDSNGCITTSGVTLSEPPAITAVPLSSTPDTIGTSVGTATISSVSGGAPPYNYNWTPSGDTGSIATGLTAGIYTVTVTDANGCPYVDSVSVGNVTGIFETDSDIKFDIYPNPTEGLITFDIELPETVDIEIQICSVLGQLLYRKYFGAIQKTRYDLNLRDLPNGVYFIKLVTPENTVNKRIVITR